MTLGEKERRNEKQKSLKKEILNEEITLYMKSVNIPFFSLTLLHEWLVTC